MMIYVNVVCWCCGVFSRVCHGSICRPQDMKALHSIKQYASLEHPADYSLEGCSSLQPRGCNTGPRVTDTTVVTVDGCTAVVAQCVDLCSSLRLNLSEVSCWCHRLAVAWPGRALPCGIRVAVVGVAPACCRLTNHSMSDVIIVCFDRPWQVFWVLNPEG